MDGSRANLQLDSVERDDTRELFADPLGFEEIGCVVGKTTPATCVTLKGSCGAEGDMA